MTSTGVGTAVPTARFGRNRFGCIWVRGLGSGGSAAGEPSLEIKSKSPKSKKAYQNGFFGSSRAVFGRTCVRSAASDRVERYRCAGWPRSTASRARKQRCERMAGLVLPAAASLVDQLDKRVLVILRDGRNLVGVMRSFDQFSNVVLEDAVERRVVIPAKEGVNAVYGDAPLGLYVVRGDSIVLLGEVDDAREASPQHPARMDIRDVLELERAGLAERAVVWDIEES